MRVRVGVLGWDLWRQPVAAVAWLLTWETIIASWVIWTVAHARYRPSDLLALLVLAGCAISHVVATQQADERRRGRNSTENVDQTSVWLWTSAVVLPAAAVLALLAILRGFRWRVATKASWRFTFSTAAQAASALSVNTVATTTGLDVQITGRGPHGGLGVGSVAAGAACIAVYVLAQHVLLLRPARRLLRARDERGPWWRTLWGESGATQRIVGTLVVAAVAAAAISVSLWLAIGFVPVLIHYTRLEQKAAQLAVEAAQLSRDAVHDPLTGLLNRRGFDPQARVVLDTGPAALLMVDVDHFRRWNARLGHLGADEVLKAITTALTRTCRTSDLISQRHGDGLVGRWGGEEMVVMLPGADRDTALAIAERIRQNVAAIRLRVTRSAGGGTVIVGTPDCPAPTCTIGVALAPDHGQDLPRLHEVADQAMYAGKHAGRNVVAITDRSGVDVQPTGKPAGPTT